MSNRTQVLPHRFWERVDFLSSNLGCWLWTAGTASRGYGAFYWEGRGHPAHRLSYADMYGEIPEHLEIDHLCRTRTCVNPSHLEAVPQKVNCLRGISPSANAARQTECSKGHSLLDPANIYAPVPSRPNTRTCKICARERAALQRERARAVRGSKVA